MLRGRVLVIDIGTTGTRAAVVQADATVAHVEYRRTPPLTPFAGLVEFDPIGLVNTVRELCESVLARVDGVDALGITNQRGSTVVWDRKTGEPLGNGLGWQDLRTVGECITAKAQHGMSLAPNQTATKAAWILDQFDPQRTRDLCIGTIDSWVTWNLTEGRAHVTDRSNAGITGLIEPDGSAWSHAVLAALRVDESMLPTLVDTSGPIAPATALSGAPMIAAVVGDQQASLIGQGCVRPGTAKCTFGTGGMLDMVSGSRAPRYAGRLSGGTFPIACWGLDGKVTWGVEAIMLAAGSNIEWLHEDLGLIATPADSAALAASVPNTEGVVYVPALMGLGTPRWDYGARGIVLGATRGTTRAHLVRAVLEGVAHRGADLLEAAEADTGLRVRELRVDGGMSNNPVFLQSLADAIGRTVEVAPYAESTTLGAGFLAGLAVGLWADLDAIGETWRPRARVEPGADTQRSAARDRWREAVDRSAGWIPALSALDF
jgi:glycerol kinase